MNAEVNNCIVVTVKLYSHQTTLQLMIHGHHAGMKCDPIRTVFQYKFTIKPVIICVLHYWKHLNFTKPTHRIGLIKPQIDEQFPCH